MHTVTPPKPRPATPDQLAGILTQAGTASQAVRGIVHDTLGCDAIAAPELYLILDQLEDLAYALDQALRQLAGSLVHSLAVWDVREDIWDAKPATSVAQACDQLDDAATYAYRAGRRTAAARAVIAGQSYTGGPNHTTTSSTSTGSTSTASTGTGAGR